MEVKEELIHCYDCNEWLTPQQWYLPEGEGGKVCCLKGDHILGYSWDKAYRRLFGNEEGEE